jgi:methane/ammonia monooxygenase subunit C
LGGWSWGIYSILILLALTAVFRIYDGIALWNSPQLAALDSSTTYFAIFFRGWTALCIISVGLIALLWWGWILRSANDLPEARGMVISHREEVRRIAVFWSMIGMISVNLYIEASFWPNMDGAYHQTLVRDTAFTVAHIPMFYFFFPLGVVLAVGTYLYGRTRLPAIYGADKGFPWSFFLLISATVTEVAQVAMNEWGHSINLGGAGAEEFFAVWFHWPFVLYGWLAGGIFALWGETIIRLYTIEDDIVKQEREAAAPTGATV